MKDSSKLNIRRLATFDCEWHGIKLGAGPVRLHEARQEAFRCSLPPTDERQRWIPQAMIGWLKALMAESLLGRKEERVDVGVGTGATWHRGKQKLTKARVWRTITVSDVVTTR